MKWKLATIASFCFAMICGTAHASLIWSGDPSQGVSVFKNLNIEDAGGTYQSNPSPNGSSVKVINDATYGQVFQFYKAVNDRRCEGHGASGFTPAIGSTYYIGWRFKLNNLIDDNAVFQWKAYGSPMVQNYPVVIKMVGGQLQLHYFPPNSGDVVLWSRAISVNTFYGMTLKIKVSDQTSGGSISFWFDGAQQTLSNNSTSYTGKTFDGSSVDPKWGIYGASSSQITDVVGAMKIGTAFSDVDPGSSSGIDTNAIYKIQNEASGMVLNNQGSTSNGTAITQWSASTVSQNLEWKFVPTSNGYYEIRNVLSDRDAVVQGASTTQGAGIVQWSFGSSGNDQWKPNKNSDGSYTFVNLHSGQVLDDPGSSTSSIQMDQWPSNGGANQKWKLLKQ